MKKAIVCFVLGVCVFTAHAQSLRVPAPSTTQTVKQEFGIGSVELSYSRPNVKGRTIFGDLVPFNAVWRTGANSATTLTFSDEVTIGGKKIPAGKYGLLTIPGASEWTIIISKQTDVTSPSAYKQEMDVVRLKASVQNLPFPIETFLIMFEHVNSNSLDLMIVWEQTSVSFSITQDIDSKIMGQIDNLMNKDNRPYYNAAIYYLENGKDLNQASVWFDKALEQNPNAYYMWYQKARCLAKLGKTAEAKATAVKSMELAKTAKNPDYVTLNEKLIASLK